MESAFFSYDVPQKNSTFKQMPREYILKGIIDVTGNFPDLAKILTEQLKFLKPQIWKRFAFYLKDTIPITRLLKPRPTNRPPLW